MGQQINKVEKRRRRKSYLKRKHEASKALSAIETVKKKTVGKKGAAATKGEGSEVKKKAATKKKAAAKKKITAPKTDDISADASIDTLQDEE